MQKSQWFNKTHQRDAKKARPEQSQRVIVGMSGGVDSSVAVALLKERGFDVRGVYMKNWSDPEWPCPWQEERRDAMAVAAKLGIPFETWDFSKEYYASVTEYMIHEYAAGRTPNPDVMCNREVKFKVFLERALKEGADFIATGHYVRIAQVESSKLKVRKESKLYEPEKLYKLYTAHDSNKDQSYFLWTLTQNELKRCLFPIGDYTKPEIRELARTFDLPTAEKKDSQGICFVGEIDVLEFLKSKIPERTGEIVTTDGKVIGTHSGVRYFTIGQRHGIGSPGGTEPLYVVKKDIANNRLIVGPEHSPELYRKDFSIGETSWVSGVAPREPFAAYARARYRAPLKECTIMPAKAPGIFTITLTETERAITPGQSLVLYRKSQSDIELLGGGIILDN